MTLRITADPRLTPEQREVIEVDYGMDQGVLQISTRGKLVPYALRLLHIDPNSVLADPMAQQIVVANRADLEPWLFG